MASRIRTVKPDLFQHEHLFDAEVESGLPLRLAFIGLFTQVDREGRFAWRPRALAANVMPYDEGVSFSDVLDALERFGFVVRYEVEGKTYGVIPTFGEHQAINQREAKSRIPAPPSADDDADSENARARTCMHVHNNDASRECTARVTETDCTRHVHARGEGKGREGKGKEGNVIVSRGRAGAGEALPFDPVTGGAKSNNNNEGDGEGVKSAINAWARATPRRGLSMDAVTIDKIRRWVDTYGAETVVRKINECHGSADRLTLNYVSAALENEAKGITKGAAKSGPAVASTDGGIMRDAEGNRIYLASYHRTWEPPPPLEGPEYEAHSARELEKMAIEALAGDSLSDEDREWFGARLVEARAILERLGVSGTED